MKNIRFSILTSVLGLAMAAVGAVRADDSNQFSMPASVTTAPAPATYDAAEHALATINAEINLDPENPLLYIRRGNFYGDTKQWPAAPRDYNQALVLDPHNAAAKIDVSEIQFRQKQYDLARAGFSGFTNDKSFGDLASYMIFLCDLFSGHETQAAQELAVFNAAGENPSYYFGNVAWDVVHHNVDAARDYLQSAQRIYYAGKANLYSSNLIELGYLPLPSAQNP